MNELTLFRGNCIYKMEIEMSGGKGKEETQVMPCKEQKSRMGLLVPCRLVQNFSQYYNE